MSGREDPLFPNAAIPSLAQITAAMDGVFVPEDVHNIGPHYDRTRRGPPDL